TLFIGWYLLVAIFKFRWAALLMIGTVALFAAAFIPYLPASAEGIYRMVFRYAGVGTRVYGLGILFPPSITLPIFFAAMTLMPLIARQVLKLDFVEGFVFATAGMFVFIPAASENYWLLPTIVGCISPSPIFWLYVAETSLLVWFPWFWFFPNLVSWWP